MLVLFIVFYLSCFSRLCPYTLSHRTIDSFDLKNNLNAMKNVSDTMNIHDSSIGIAGHKTDIILLLHRRNALSAIFEMQMHCRSHF
jgi:hypothetical protein